MKYLNKTIEYGLYLLVFLLPWQTRWIIKAGQLNNWPWEYGTYSLYGTDILLLIILALFIVYEIASLTLAMTIRRRLDCGFPYCSTGQTPLAMTMKKDRSDRIIWWFIGGLILVSVVSVSSASYKLLALYKFGWLILGAGLFWLITSANYDRLKLIYALLAGAFFSAGLAVWQFLNQAAFANKWLGLAMHKGAELGASVILAVGAEGIGERWLRAYGSLDHPNMLGGLLAIAIIFLAGGMLKRDDGDKLFLFHAKMNYIIWILLSVFTVGLFFSFSRSAWLALAAGLIMMIALAVARRDLKSQKRLAETVLVMSILLFVLFSQYQNLVVTRFTSQGRLEDKSNFERLVSFKESWQIIKKDWLIGVGPGNYTFVLNKATPEQVSYYYQPAHNVFLLVLSEIGIAGLIFFLGLFFVMARNSIFGVTKQSYVPVIPGLTRDPGVSSRDSFLDCGSGAAMTRRGIASSSEYEAPRNDSKTAVLIALVVIMLFDHWFFSLHFGVLFFWLVLALVYRQYEENNEQPR